MPSPMPHRIAVIGQSNAIMGHGFVRHLMERADVEIGHMGRIGASPSIILPFFAGPDFLRGHDFLVIDTAVVDQVFLWAEAIDPGMISAYVAYACHQAHMAGCQPILLVIPHREAVPQTGDPRTPMLSQIYRAAARHHGATCLDLVEPLRRLRAADPRAFAAAYSDPNHLSDTYSRHVAARLAAVMNALAAAPPPRRPRRVALPLFSRVQLAPMFAGETVVERTNSVFTTRFVVMGATTRMRVAVGPIARLHGLLVNRSVTNAKLLIEGAGRTVKMLGTQAEREHEYVAQVLPLINPVLDDDDHLTLSIVPPDTLPTEVSWNPLPEASEHAEVAELLLDYGVGEEEIAVPVIPQPLQLVQ